MRFVEPWEVDRLREAQKDKCAICREPWREGKRRYCIDHDHKTGEIRGLLCQGCNMGLGWFKDDPKRLKKAIKYLKKYGIE